MFEPVPTNIDRARVRRGDLGAAWLLVALILLGSALSGTFSAAATEAVHAASAARCELASALHEVPKLLGRIHQA